MSVEAETKQADPLESLKKLKTNAAQIFASKGFPTTKNEDYKYLNFGKALQNSWPDAMAIENQKFLCPIAIDAFVLTFINGLFKAEYSNLDGLPATVSFGTLEKVLQEVPTMAKKLGALADISDGFVAHNSAHFNQGFGLKVRKGTTLEKPIYVLNYFTGDQSGFVQSRNLVSIEESAEAVLYSHSFGATLGTESFFNVVTEIALSPNATFSYTQIQEGGANLQTVDYLICDLQTSSRFNHQSISLNGKLVRNNTQLLLNGKGAEGHMYGVFLPATNEVFDNHTLVDHRVAHCPSNELYKGVALGKGTGVFNGKIFVRQDAQKTNAFQSNKNLLLSDDAAIFTKPQLEIYADDVKCSHGSSTGQLDEKALFYLQSRGIGMESAKRLLVTAFAEEILDQVKNNAVRLYLEEAIETKLATY